MQELFQHFLEKHKVVQTSVSDRFFLPTNNSNDLQSILNHAKSSESLLQTGGETQSGMNKSVPDVSNALTQTGGKQSTRNRKQKTTFRVKRTTNSISALNNAANKHYITPGADEKYDLLTFLANMHTDVVNHLQKRCQELKQIVWYVAVKVDMQRQSVDGVTQISTPHFRSSSFKILDANFSASDIDKGFQSLYNNFKEYNDRGSGWSLKKIIHIEISTIVYDPLPGRTYFTEPTKIKNSKAILNIQNVDEKCFLWCVLAALHPVENIAQRVKNYTPFENELCVKGIDFPVKVNQIPKFEKQNKLSINVIGYDEEEDHFFPVYISSMKNAVLEIDLLKLNCFEDSHYVLIRSLSRLLARTKCKGHKYFFCRYCLQGFLSQKVLDNHKQLCSHHHPQSTLFPVEGVNDTLKFTENKFQLRVPFCIYADFEAFPKDVETCYPDPNKSSITCYTKFEACSYGYQVVCSDERYTKSPVIYRGLNAVQNFLESLHEEELNIKEILQKNCPMIMTDVDKEHFKKQNQCFLCENYVSPETGKVRDHCHVSRKYRGAACTACNLNFKPPTFIPVVFHNLKNFDLHLLIHGIGMWKKEDISCIPHNMERYLSLSLGNLRFIDSLQFLNASLEELVENLASDGLKPFRLLQKEFQDPAQTHLMKRKGVYPYNYVKKLFKI